MNRLVRGGVNAKSKTQKPSQTPPAKNQDTQNTAEEQNTGPTPEPVSATKSKKPERNWKFSAGLGYQLVAGAGTFDDGSFSDGTKVESELEYKPAVLLILEGRHLRENSWGFIGGLQYETQREFKKGKIKSEGVEVSLTGGSGASKVQFTTIYASAAYRWDQFYLPFGFNISIVEFTQGVGSSGTVDASGGIGAQLGAGWMFNDHFALELYSWVTSMDLSTTTSGVTLDYKTGYFPSLALVGKVSF